jgi:pilus assembly protein CpaF
VRRADGFGPLSSLVSEAEVTDIFLNGPAETWVDRGAGLVREPTVLCGDEASLRALATRLVALGGRHVDEANPSVDVRVGAGIRVHVVLPPISPRGTLVSIRLPRVQRPSMTDLHAGGMFPGSLLEVLTAAVAARTNLLITGAAGSGKTTLLSALLALAPPGERIVTVEDVAELRVEHPHVVSLESRQANLEGAGLIGLDRLVREALRMRPDRLVVGECRGPEVRDLLAALNTGHDGGAGTLHANSVDDVPSRLEALGAAAGLSPEALGRQAVSAIGLIVHLGRSGSVRCVEGVGKFRLDARDRLTVVPVSGDRSIALSAEVGRNG